MNRTKPSVVSAGRLRYTKLIPITYEYGTLLLESVLSAMNRIALKMLFGDRLKFFTLVAGLTFSALLITQQGSIFCGLLKRFIVAIENTNVPIWVMDPENRFIDDVKPLQETDLYRIRSIGGVGWAMPYLKRLSQVQLPSGKSQNVQLIGYDSQTLIGLPTTAIIAGNVLDLNSPDAVFVDKKALTKLAANEDTPATIGSVFEMEDKRARIVGIVDVANGFQSFPQVMTTYDRAKTYMPPQRKMLSYVLVSPQDNQDPEELAERITKQTGLLALTQEQYITRTLDYFVHNTGIPINFGITVMLGVLIGAAVSAQTFYTFTIENLKQFATFKAMGASSGVLVRMILLQALTVGLIGYGIGVGLASLFGAMLLRAGTELAYFTPWQLPVLCFFAVVIVCLLSSLLSIVKVIRLEPAAVFSS
ncbi:MAG: ABC transporter permease [Vampirovibrionales bacterium]|nr:ABC transporter permease [Vampirovibrionales bacterium]